MWHQLQTLLSIKEQIIQKWTIQFVLSSIIYTRVWEVRCPFFYLYLYKHPYVYVCTSISPPLSLALVNTPCVSSYIQARTLYICLT
jgi:hypothetical protein